MDAAGECALHKAACRPGRHLALKALLAGGADPRAKVGCMGQRADKGFCCGENAGLTALQLAEQRKLTIAVELLRGAEIRADEADKASIKAAFNIPEVQQKLQEKEDEISCLSQCKEELLNKLQLWRGDLSACRGRSAEELEALLRDQEQHVAALRQRVLERHREEAAQAAATEAKEAAAEAALCMICLERQRDVFLNCGHLVCSTCAVQLRNCPACRVAITCTTRAWL